MLINCHGGGSCQGGDPASAFHYMAANGIPDETCQNYEAVNMECAPFGVCETCVVRAPSTLLSLLSLRLALASLLFPTR